MQAISRVPHITQESDWDCGLACVAMVSRALDARYSIGELRTICGVESVWTIDLAYLLRKLSDDALEVLPRPHPPPPQLLSIPMLSPRRDEGWDFTYYTTTIGANSAYSKERFYRKSFDADQTRVNELFENATSSNIRIIEMMLPLDDFRRFLSCGQYAIIVLVNMRLLSCHSCMERAAFCSCSTGTLGTVIQRMKGYRYVGHFVVLVKYDPSTDEFFYRDPGVNDDLCVISAKNLDKARRSSGTDHDCIVIKVL